MYITGGAQGGEQINGLMREVPPWLLSAANVVHQCGPNWVERSRQAAEGLPPEHYSHDLRKRCQGVFSV
ncbi:glycosyltransferase [Streptomyces similanensis]|uniref:Glycosyl transferase family 28 C-terminal domain-containing protein n=1 Tax=Streptomyces similanensis TaxID=1274988 RepID=A0ABP9JZM9_9ACTN